MYFVDRSKIEEILTYMDQVLGHLSNASYQTFQEKAALERMVHVVIESVLDVGNMMIDGFIMRDPGSYDDIIDILIDEKVLESKEEKAYKDLIQLRKMIVNDYTLVNHALLKRTLEKYEKYYNTYSKQIYTYLDNELGVANAFSNE